MGTFRHPVRIGRLDGTAFEALEALVDTGATYTWIPRQVLERLGIPPAGQRRLQLANGQIIEREIGLVLVAVDGLTVATTCVFGDPDSLPLLGAVTLEECGLAPDPVRKQLIPVIGLLASQRREQSLPGSDKYSIGRFVESAPRPTRRDPKRQFCYAWPAQRAMQQIRERVREAIGRGTVQSL